MSEENDDEGQDVQARERRRQAFEVARRAADAVRPGETPLDHPAAR
jgi:hypothetical protein